MARKTFSVSFKNAEIDVEADTITETSKDDTKVYKLSSVLSEFDKIQGLTISIKKDDELESEDVDSNNAE